MNNTHRLLSPTSAYGHRPNIEGGGILLWCRLKCSRMQQRRRSIIF